MFAPTAVPTAPTAERVVATAVPTALTIGRTHRRVCNNVHIIFVAGGTAEGFRKEGQPRARGVSGKGEGLGQRKGGWTWGWGWRRVSGGGRGEVP